MIERIANLGVLRYLTPGMLGAVALVWLIRFPFPIYDTNWTLSSLEILTLLLLVSFSLGYLFQLVASLQTTRRVEKNLAAGYGFDLVFRPDSQHIPLDLKEKILETFNHQNGTRITMQELSAPEATGLRQFMFNFCHAFIGPDSTANNYKSQYEFIRGMRVAIQFCGLIAVFLGVMSIIFLLVGPSQGWDADEDLENLMACVTLVGFVPLANKFLLRNEDLMEIRQAISVYEVYLADSSNRAHVSHGSS